MNKIDSDNPFSLKIRLAELYSNQSIFLNFAQFFSILLNSIGGKDFLILVIGEYQSGKTSLLSKFVSQIEFDVKPCRFKIKENDDPALNDNYHPGFLYKKEHGQVTLSTHAYVFRYSTEIYP